VWQIYTLGKDNMNYPVAEKFKSLQGEGIATGQPMAFIRLVGCSVGKEVCTHCDTNFSKTYPELGGGMFSETALAEWVSGMTPCLTGGEPFDRDLEPLCAALVLHFEGKQQIHVESSGTKEIPEWAKKMIREGEMHLTISPKPGWLINTLFLASEIKVIHQGLGDGEGWPTLRDALRWAKSTPTYLQPRNFFSTVDPASLQQAMDIVLANPSLRLSVQLHKFLEVR